MVGSPYLVSMSVELVSAIVRPSVRDTGVRTFEQRSYLCVFEVSSIASIRTVVSANESA